MIKRLEIQLQYNIKREAAKLSTFLSGKIDKFEYLTVEETLPSDQSRMIEEAYFSYSPIGKALNLLNKTNKNQ